MFKTGGTPYNVVENKAQADPGLFLPAAAINELRRNLVAELSEQRGIPPQRRVGTIPAKPRGTPSGEEPAMIFQVLNAEQLTPELAALKPKYLYVPMMVMSEYFDLLEPFEEHGTIPVVVLPRVITDEEEPLVRQILEKLFDFGINEALVGNLGHAMLAKSVGMRVRGDFGLNVFNSLTLDMVRQAGFLSATASFELRISQIRDLSKTLDTEMIVYGRLPLMVSDQCVIRHSSGRCTCSAPAQMADRMGAVFPVVKEFGCRNVIYNAHKLYLADKAEDLYSAQLWGMRMMFTTETPRECLEVARVYLGLSDYQPNVLTRGLYYRGVE
jgi:putative protease